MVTTPLGRLNVSLATGAGLFVALVVPFLTFAAGRIAFGLEAVVDNSAGVLAGVASVFLTGVLVSTLGLSSDVQLATSRAQRPDSQHDCACRNRCDRSVSCPYGRPQLVTSTVIELL